MCLCVYVCVCVCVRLYVCMYAGMHACMYGAVSASRPQWEWVFSLASYGSLWWRGVGAVGDEWPVLVLMVSCMYVVYVGMFVCR